MLNLYYDPIYTDGLERTMRLVGGSLAALEDALSQNTIAGNMAGGTHHAYRDCGSGYCIFNDIAICALAALKNPTINKVLILDLDVHQGDGTASPSSSLWAAATPNQSSSRSTPLRIFSLKQPHKSPTRP